MKIIEPSVELWKQNDVISHVARCARICYYKESDDDQILCNNLVNSKHWSMFHHETVYAIIPTDDVLSMWSSVMGKYMESPYINWVNFRDNFYVVTNGNFLLDVEKKNPILYKWLIEYRVDTDTFEKEAKIPSIKEMIRYTFKVTTQISTSIEFNRVNTNNISEQYTRYVYENGTLCRPWWLNIKDNNICTSEKYTDEIITEYINGCYKQFSRYKRLVDKGMNKQDARGVLPIDTATICAYTYSVEEWRHILDLRYYDTTGILHSNVKIIAGMIREELIKLSYKFR